MSDPLSSETRPFDARLRDFWRVIDSVLEPEQLARHRNEIESKVDALLSVPHQEKMEGYFDGTSILMPSVPHQEETREKNDDHNAELAAVENDTGASPTETARGSAFGDETCPTCGLPPCIACSDCDYVRSLRAEELAGLIVDANYGGWERGGKSFMGWTNDPRQSKFTRCKELARMLAASKPTTEVEKCLADTDVPHAIDALIAAVRDEVEDRLTRAHTNDEGPLKLNAYGRRCYRAGQLSVPHQEETREQNEHDLSRSDQPQQSINGPDQRGEASGNSQDHGKICPQDGSVCWEPGCSVSYCEVTRERDEARRVVRDTLWMAGRYADGRRSYAVGLYNDALAIAQEGGYAEGAKPARDGMFDPPLAEDQPSTEVSSTPAASPALKENSQPETLDMAGTEPRLSRDLNEAISAISVRVGLHADLEVIDVVDGYEARLCNDSGATIARGDGKTVQSALIALAGEVGSVSDSQQEHAATTRRSAAPDKQSHDLETP